MFGYWDDLTCINKVSTRPTGARQRRLGAEAPAETSPAPPHYARAAPPAAAAVMGYLAGVASCFAALATAGRLVKDARLVKDEDAPLADL